MIAVPDTPCPFKVGDTVFYRPLIRESGLVVMHAPEGQPKVGEAVRITNIVDGKYVIYEGYDHPAGGIYWTAFSAT